MPADRNARPRIVVFGTVLLFAVAFANEFTLAYLFAADRSITGAALTWIRGIDAVLACLLVTLPWWASIPGRIVLAGLRRAPNTTASALGLAGLASIFVALEFGFHAYNINYERNHPRPYKTFSASLLEWPVVCHSTRVDGDHLDYDVTYTVDKRGSRITPDSPAAPTGLDLVFFGGSFTFGEGVEDRETLPNQVALRAPQWRVTNFGFPGYGPSQMLRRIEDPDLTDPFTHGRSHAIYVYIAPHVGRVIGSMRIATTWARDYPYYALGSDGSLEYRGTFTDGRPLRTRVYRWLSKDPVLTFFNMDWPPRVTSGDYKLTARVVQECRNRWLAMPQPASFTVVIYPSNRERFGPNENFIPYLESRQIPYLDYSGRFDELTDVWIPGDGHPTAAAHDRVAEWLVEDLHLAGAKLPTPR